MTEHDDDLDTLRTAMRAATPAPDTARRAQTIAGAVDVFHRRHGPMHQSAGGRTWRSILRLPQRRPLWTGLGVGTTALGAFLLVALPPAQMSETKGARPAAPAFARSQAAPEAPENGSAAIAPTEERLMTGAATLSDAAPQGPVMLLRVALADGQLPPAGRITADALVQLLTPALAPRPPQSYAVPWSDDILLRDNGNDTEEPRFALVPHGDTADVPAPVAPDDIRYVIGLSGFARLLETGAGDLSGWDYQDALALVQDTVGPNPDPRQREAIALIQAASAVTSADR